MLLNFENDPYDSENTKLCLDNERIYTCFAFLNELGENSSPIVGSIAGRSRTWGQYKTKPVAQIAWEKVLSNAADEIADFHPYMPEPHPGVIWAAQAATWRDGYQGQDMRPRVRNGIDGEHILLDSGAMVKRFPGAKLNEKVTLEAVNKDKILTYGTVEIQVRVGRKLYTQVATLADIDQPVLGFDYMKNYKISMVWSEFGDLQFWDRKAQITAPLDITPNARGKWPNLAGYRLVHWSDPKSVQGWCDFLALPAISAVEYNSFQQYSQLQAAEANKETVEIPIPAEYKQLLAKYPDITKCDFMAKTVKHGVIHHIDTGSNPPPVGLK